MPCNLPLVNRSVTIATKVIIKEQDSLMLALYDLAQADRSFFYEETPDGIKVRTKAGEVTLVWEGDRYIVKAQSQRQGEVVMAPLLSMYQSVVVQNIFIEKGFMTERTPDIENKVQLVAWRG